MIEIPLHTSLGGNNREHHMVRSKRVKDERWMVHVHLQQYAFHFHKPVLPLRVYLTRIGPTAGLDDDNLAMSLKAVRDQVAAWLGVDDGDREQLRFAYSQHRDNHWGVQIEFAPFSKDEQP